MNMSYLLWFDDPVFQKISSNEKFLEEYRPALNQSLDHASRFILNKYGMATRAYCFSFDNESKYNLFLIRFA